MGSGLPFLLRTAGLLSGLAPVLAFGQQAETTAATSPDLGGSLLQLGFGFVVVLAVLFASLWLLKRMTSPKGQSAHLMKIVSTLAVGPRERVVLMEVGELWLVLGVGPGHMTKLGEVPRQSLPPAPSVGTTPDFPAWLKRALDNRTGRGA